MSSTQSFTEYGSTRKFTSVNCVASPRDPCGLFPQQVLQWILVGQFRLVGLIQIAMLDGRPQNPKAIQNYEFSHFMKPGQDVSRNTLGHDHCSLEGACAILLRLVRLYDFIVLESTRKRYGYQDHLQRSAPNQAARSGSQTRSQKNPWSSEKVWLA